MTEYQKEIVLNALDYILAQMELEKINRELQSRSVSKELVSLLLERDEKANRIKAKSGRFLNENLTDIKYFRTELITAPNKFTESVAV